MDSIFRIRGSGVSSDVETTIVPQLLSEIDGVQGLDNVIVIGASNREDMIDPAIMRPGRLDVKIKIVRPDAEAAKDIFAKHLAPDLPIHLDDLAAHGGDRHAAIANMIRRAVEFLYAENEINKFLEVTYQSGEKEIIYFHNFSSGAVIRNIVDRAKRSTIKRYLETGNLGLRVQDMLNAAEEEIKVIEDLTGTTNPDDWARIAGSKGEQITFIRTLTQRGTRFEGRSLEIIRSNYLM
jgi:proteasome-associated ATPase